MRATLADAFASRIPAIANLAPTDSRLTDLINEAQQRLITRGKFHNLTHRYAMCLTDGCLTLPRQVATVEAAWVCNHPILIRNQWFEYLQSGYGMQGEGNCSNGHCHPCGGANLIDRGFVCVFADIIGINKKIKVYADVAEDADAKILLQGYDENNNWIRTQVSGEWVDGEYVAISNTPATSTKFFSSLVSVQKPETNGVVRLYEYDTTLATQRAIAVYEPDETRPEYRRVMIPGLTGTGTTDDCETTPVTVIVKLNFIAAKKATDWLMIGCIPALKDMVQSVMKSENNLFQEAVAWETKAVNELDKELHHYQGDGVVQPIRMPSRWIAGGGVESLI